MECEGIMKVYCKDCKNHAIWNYGMHVCKIDVYKDSIGIKTVPHRRTCYNRNEKHNCSSFKAKLLKKRKYKKPVKKSWIEKLDNFVTKIMRLDK